VVPRKPRQNWTVKMAKMDDPAAFRVQVPVLKRKKRRNVAPLRQVE
jgi:hypothetical protein